MLLLLLVVAVAAETAEPLRLGGRRESHSDGGQNGTFGGGQKGRPDEPARKPDFTKHADRPRP